MRGHPWQCAAILDGLRERSSIVLSSTVDATYGECEESGFCPPEFCRRSCTGSERTELHAFPVVLRLVRRLGMIRQRCDGLLNPAFDGSGYRLPKLPTLSRHLAQIGSGPLAVVDLHPRRNVRNAASTSSLPATPAAFRCIQRLQFLLRRMVLASASALDFLRVLGQPDRLPARLGRVRALPSIYSSSAADHRWS